MTKPMKKSEIQIFLAHAHEDKAAVIELYNRLKNAGYKPWLDKKDLIPGQDWTSGIPKAIKKSQLFIACLSTRSVAKRGYVQNEFKMALKQMASLPPGSIYFIPLRFDECRIPDLRQDEYGINLQAIHWLDYWEDDGFEQLERAIIYEHGPFDEDSDEKVKNVPNIAPKTKILVDKTEELILQVKPSNKKKQEEPKFESFTEDLGNGTELEMIAIPGGTFMMGSENYKPVKPQHQVAVQAFYMGKYPVTQAQYQEIMGDNPSRFKGDDRRPVEKVSWKDAEEFCKQLSKQTGKEYRLPSEAEWEYACRAGTTTAYYFGESITEQQANYGDNVGKTTTVGKYPPNAFGLYDMHGNVWEFCQDDWHDNYKGAPNSGKAWISEKSNTKVIRGCSWCDDPILCPSDARIDGNPEKVYDNNGFRVVCRVPRT